METPRNKGGIAGCQIPILADFTKKASADYGVLLENLGLALRGLFLIDPDGVIQATLVNNLPIGRNADEVLRLIDAFQENKKNGTVCPMGWKKGKEAITPAKAAEWFQKNVK
jgi:alkyl hydroperoxide reductase subunit AhpC